MGTEMRLLLALTVAAASVAPTLAAGGNCKNLCQNAQKPQYFDSCISEHCEIVPDSCRNATTVTDECKCSEECQGCFNDIFDPCEGCTDKSGYDFDADEAPAFVEAAEEVGCVWGSASVASVNLAVVSAAALAWMT